MPGTLRPVGDLFDGYGASARGLTEAAFDEMVGHDGAARAPYAAVASSLAQMGPEDVSARASRLARAFMDQGVTFDLDGEERPFPLDVVPRIFTAGEWSKVAAGVAQRVRALELFLDDVYGVARIVSDGLIPHEVVTSSPGFVRAAFGYTPPNGVRIHVAGIDVIRDEDGEFRVLEDNLRSPSGVSYVLANRAAMARVLPELFWGQPIQMVTDYPAHLINALRRAAPASVQDPTVVVLTPGVHNSAFYEHALLARLMGVHLVEGRDLVCHGTDVFLRTTEGEVPVHVIYRRIDDDYLDPLQFRPESLVGCPGVVNAARAGRVTIANGVGNGVADDKLVYTYVPAMIRYYLGEDPILHNVETMHLVDDRVRKDALARRGRARVQARGRLGRQGPGDRAGRHRGRARRAGARGGGRPPPLDRPAGRRPLHGAHLGRPVDGPAPRRPAAFRGERRRGRLGPPRRPHPGRAAGGRPGGQLQPGRRLQGHLGGRGRAVDARAPAAPVLAPPGRAAPGRRSAGGQRERGATATTTATAAAAAAAAGTPSMTRALLSRVAESIFWVGRYVERAEGTARILDVSVYQALEQSDVEGSHAARRLLAVMGLPEKGNETLWQATERLAVDPDSRSSIAGALAAARENTRAVRHVVPVEFWEHINATWAELPVQWEAGRRAGPAFYLSFVKTQCAGMMGLADTMMSRDQTWLFFTLGRCLERTDVVARQLATVAFDEVFDSGLVMLLRSCGGYEPYLRLSQGVVEPGRVLDFLLRDRLFPRSAFASLTLAEDCLDQINAGREGTWDDARGLVGLARAELEYSAPATLSRGLETRLERLQASISSVSDAVTRRYFAQDLPTQWRQGGGGG